MAKHYGLDAAGETADVKRGDLAYFYPEDLIPNDKNYRFGSFDSDPAVKSARELEIEAMVQSLCAERQKQPVRIHQVPGNRFKVHAGDTRHQAFLRINERGIWPHGKPDEGGRARIECRVESFYKDAEREIFGYSIVENLSRNNLTVRRGDITMTAIHQKQIARATARLRKFMSHHEGLSRNLILLDALTDCNAEVMNRPSEMARRANMRWHPDPNKPAKVSRPVGRPRCACGLCPTCKKRLQDT